MFSAGKEGNVICSSGIVGALRTASSALFGSVDFELLLVCCTFRWPSLAPVIKHEIACGIISLPFDVCIDVDELLSSICFVVGERLFSLFMVDERA